MDRTVNWTTIAIRLTAALLLGTLCGCGPTTQMVAVTGCVSYRGKPLEYGSVMFQPVGVDGGAAARSKIESDGTFALWTVEPNDGVAIGTCKVRITAFAAQKTNASGGQHEEMALGKSAIPKKFQNFATSGIELDITPDMSLPLEIDLDEYL